MIVFFSKKKKVEVALQYKIDMYFDVRYIELFNQVKETIGHRPISSVG